METAASQMPLLFSSECGSSLQLQCPVQALCQIISAVGLRRGGGQRDSCSHNLTRRRCRRGSCSTLGTNAYWELTGEKNKNLRTWVMWTWVITGVVEWQEPNSYLWLKMLQFFAAYTDLERTGQYTWGQSCHSEGPRETKGPTEILWQRSQVQGQRKVLH